MTAHQHIEVGVVHGTHRHDAAHHDSITCDPESETGELAPIDGKVAETGAPRSLDAFDGRDHGEARQSAVEPAMQRMEHPVERHRLARWW
jgi:hypothetical protein